MMDGITGHLGVGYIFSSPDYHFMIVGVKGRPKEVNHAIFLRAVKCPSLLIDCANCANPHVLPPTVLLEQLCRVYVMEIDLLYSFRDALKRLSFFLKSMNIEMIFVTTTKHLFHYGNLVENQDVMQHAWEIMLQLSSEIPFVVGVDSGNRSFAEKYCARIDGIT